MNTTTLPSRPPAAACPAARPLPPGVRLRGLLPGDIGWVVQQHGEVYAREYGWDGRFEALVARIAAQFVEKFRPGLENAWIAVRDHTDAATGTTEERLGAVFVVRKSARTAQLRMLILAPSSRGRGLGAHLTDECIAFAKDRGYRKMVLWTNSCLTTARHLYARRGFVLKTSEPYEGFGQSLVGEHWERVL